MQETDPDAPDRKESPPGLTRRDFLSRAGAAGVAGVAASMPFVAAATEIAPPPEAPEIPGTVPLALRINGTTYKIRIDPRATLLDTLRETVHLTGTKKGCDHGQCGACTVHVNGVRVNSCLRLALMKEPCGPTDADVKELMSGNICRCGAYPNIVAAIQQVRGNA